MKIIVIILIFTLFSGCLSTKNIEFHNYPRELKEHETILIGNIEYLQNYCKVEGELTCYIISMENGMQYPLVFNPIIPTKVFLGKYDLTGHFVTCEDKRYDKAFSVRLWSLVK